MQDASESESDSDEKFTERPDLVRIDVCLHRFHALCLYRDWFMERQPSKDQYGELIQHAVPESKRCPVCRRECNQSEVDYVAKIYQSNPEIEDQGYQD